MSEEYTFKYLLNAYEKNSIGYEKMCNIVELMLQDSLKSLDIPIIDIQTRVKDIDSLITKSITKNINDPISELNDICGVRVICLFKGHIPTIIDCIKRNFISEEDRRDRSPDRMGYHSRHFIINFCPKTYSHIPFYDDIKSFKAEIQVRTLLEHAWAEVSHKLNYKTPEFMPENTLRKLNNLSSQLEITDSLFQEILQSSQEYTIAYSKKKREEFDLENEVNLKSLKAFINFFFPERIKSNSNEIDLLLFEIRQFEFNFKQMSSWVNKYQNLLSELDVEILNKANAHDKGGALKTILDIANDEFWEHRKQYLPRFTYGKDRIEITDRYKDKIHEEL